MFDAAGTNGPEAVERERRERAKTERVKSDVCTVYCIYRDRR